MTFDIFLITESSKLKKSFFSVQKVERVGNIALIKIGRSYKI